MRRALFLLPLLVFMGMGAFLWQGLWQDPSLVPSALIGKKAPDFAIAAIPDLGKPGLSSADLQGQVTLLSVFASWCVPCQEEHPLLMGLASQHGLRLVGMDYKDKGADAKAWLGRLGNPYSAIGADIDGRVGLDFGVYGVPESYLIDRTGTIRYKQVGPLTQDVIERTLLPLAASLAK